MTLYEWKQEQRLDLALFDLYWRDRHEKLPDHYPLEMEPGDWDEQFDIAREANLL